MAEIPLYRVKPHVKAPKWAKFPTDFDTVGWAIVDDSLAYHPDIYPYRWGVRSYAKAPKPRVARMSGQKGERRTVFLHRVVWEIVNGPIPNGLTIDHKSLDTLDNRIANLRLATQSEQMRNTSARKNVSSGYKCVSLDGRYPDAPKPWLAYISPRTYPVCYLLKCATPEEAAYAYNVAASLCYREFARLNEIPPDSVSPDRQQEIRSIVEQKLRSRGLIQTT